MPTCGVSHLDSTASPLGAAGCNPRPEHGGRSQDYQSSAPHLLGSQSALDLPLLPGLGSMRSSAGVFNLKAGRPLFENSWRRAGRAPRGRSPVDGPREVATPVATSSRHGWPCRLCRGSASGGAGSPRMRKLAPSVATTVTRCSLNARTAEGSHGVPQCAGSRCGKCCGRRADGGGSQDALAVCRGGAGCKAGP